MTLKERMERLHKMFCKLEATSSRNEKEKIIFETVTIDKQLELDSIYCFEVLAGKKKLGYTLSFIDNDQTSGKSCNDAALEEFCTPLFNYNKSFESQLKLARDFDGLGWFIVPLFNREWRLGIGASLLEIDDAPMLAKKFEGTEKLSKVEEYYITEKLDGNRCIAKFNHQLNKWEFLSRSGKTLNVEFDMTGLSIDLVYDGEVMTREQYDNPSQKNFNQSSGLLNKKAGDKTRLIYVIFDFMSNLSYKERSAILRGFTTQDSRVLIHPVLSILEYNELESRLPILMQEVVNKGGEGLMINLGSRRYEHKRTNAILKYKPVYSMDMKVISVEGGTGKNEGIVGALYCEATDSKTSKTYMCKVGSGLSDEQRNMWADKPNAIINKIIEVEYFSISQDENARGTSYWSLRFPRLKRVRDDKEETSID